MRRTLAALLIPFTLAATAGCSADEDRTGERYCSEVQANLETLAVPPLLTTMQDVDAAIAVYEGIESHAPAAIEPEWEQLVTSLQTAATVDPNDDSSLATAAATARAAKQSAERVQSYTRQMCALDIGATAAP